MVCPDEVPQVLWTIPVHSLVHQGEYFEVDLLMYWESVQLVQHRGYVVVLSGTHDHHMLN